ncbi:MAG: hypothetical protein GVY10_03110 [Verrucomicrobia bacterium]|jgi:hypothetical protein|nr:hypothetical protein [Verrucomicrobiota bacterium]
MKPISKSSEQTKKPTIIRVSAHEENKAFTVEEAESILRKEGFRPLSKMASIRFRKFRNPDY